MNNSLNLMHSRLGIRGGEWQQDRMIKDKRKTLDKVVLYSYQGAKVRKLDSIESARALINPNKVKQDYDDKVISIGYEYDFKPGTVFDWENTNTKWLIYLQDLTELAYFRGDIRKCNYQIAWKDEQGKKQLTYAAVTGPSEASMDVDITRAGTNLDVPNYSLEILLPATEAILKHFRRYTKFYLKPLASGDSPTCWRIEATDTISMPGILQLNAKEYYANEDKDDLTEGVVDGLVVEEIPKPQDMEIVGDTFIKPKMTYIYEYTGSEEGEWSFDKRLPITAKSNGKKISLTWNTTYTGQFILSYGSKEKMVVVESLFINNVAQKVEERTCFNPNWTVY